MECSDVLVTCVMGLEPLSLTATAGRNISIEDNVAAMGKGGGIYIDSGKPQFGACSIRNNSADHQSGGGVYAVLSRTSGILQLTNGTLVEANRAWSQGGGLFVELPIAVSDIFALCSKWDGLVTGNTARQTGGGMMFKWQYQIGQFCAPFQTTSAMEAACAGMQVDSTNRVLGGYGPQRASIPTRLAIIMQPYSPSSPTSVIVRGGMHLALATQDIFGQEVRGNHRSIMVAHLKTDPLLPTTGMSDWVLENGNLTVGGNGLDSSMFAIAQGELGAPFRVNVSVRSPMDLSCIAPAQTEWLEVGDCIHGLHHCQCDDPACGCRMRNATQFTCVTQTIHQKRVPAWVWGCVAAGCFVVVLVASIIIYLTRRARSAELRAHTAEVCAACASCILGECACSLSTRAACRDGILSWNRRQRSGRSRT